MNHTHISVINAINKLKQLNTNINMIPQSLSTDQEQAICRNCQVFTKQLTKISIENQRLD
jgi:hypothetical protein